jgi:hypothetical protein
VQDFYPTPGTISTAMFYTGLDPYTLEPVYVPRTPKEKAEQRALLQYFKPENHAVIRTALLKAGRRDLIGCGPHCLVPADPHAGKPGQHPQTGRGRQHASQSTQSRGNQHAAQQKHTRKPQQKRKK